MPSEILMWNRAAETMLREQLQALQLQRLRAMVSGASRRACRFMRSDWPWQASRPIISNRSTIWRASLSP